MSPFLLRSIIAISAIFTYAWVPVSAQVTGTDFSELKRLASIVKPTAEELRWQEIPWELDLAGALEKARAEKRPIFFWAAGGRKRDGLPLERC